jgi:cell division protein FtsN
VADYNRHPEALQELPGKKRTFGDHSWILALNSKEFTTRRMAPALDVPAGSLTVSPGSAETGESAAAVKAAELLASANAIIEALEKRIAGLETRLATAEAAAATNSRRKPALRYSPKALLDKFAANNAHRASARLLAEVAPFAVEQKTGRYYIVAGSFSTLGTANWYRKKMARMGGDAKIIMPNPENRLYMVTVGDYGSRSEGRLKLPALKRTFGLYIWIKDF